MIGIAILAVISMSTQATPLKKTAPSEDIQVRIVSGEKNTTFKLSNQKSGVYQVAMANELGARKIRDISADDYFFLREKIEAVHGTAKLERRCYRSYISIVNNGVKEFGCFDGSATYTREMRHISNLLALLF